MIPTFFSDTSKAQRGMLVKGQCSEVYREDQSDHQISP